ncbi:MAG: hypothetical protein JW839_07640 [Candidatus Lokiarchaeota archaeon]|nr:hypothetical protein [Candidatus Lokiarchaeota archaeon]
MEEPTTDPAGQRPRAPGRESPRQSGGHGSWFLDIIKRKQTKPVRSLVTLDTLKGISIITILYIHVGNVWCAPDFIALMKFQWYLLDFLGPAIYLTLSVVGNMAGSTGQGARDGSSPRPRRRLLKASFLLIYGEIINILTAWRQGIYHVTAWNVITTIAVFTLLMPYLLRLPKLIRVALLVIIVTTYYPFMEWAIGAILPHGVSLSTTTPAMLQDPRTIVYWLLFYSDMMTPVYSWLVVPIAASLIFERVVALNRPETKDDLRGEMKRVALIGLCLVMASILTSLQFIPEYNAAFLESLTAPSPYFTWPVPQGLPPFLVRHVPQYLFYCIGMECLLFSGIGWLQLVKGKRLPLEGQVNAMGQLSVTVFALSFVLSMWQLDLPLATFYLVMIPMLVLVTACCWVWTSRLGRVGTIEWLMDVHVAVLSHLLDGRQKRSPP